MSNCKSIKPFRACIVCGSHFYAKPYRINAGYCSVKCHAAGRIVKRILTQCRVCHKPIMARPKLIQEGRAKVCSRICFKKLMARPIIQSFWDRVRKTDKCWIWIGAKTEKGYGKIRAMRSHRLSWVIHNGAIPQGKHVLHNCPDGDNPSCVNPAHLWVGTNTENMEDKFSKGRGNPPVGERNVNSKLTGAIVVAMRLERAGEKTSYKELGVKYGVSESTAMSACTRRTWRHVQ